MKKTFQLIHEKIAIDRRVDAVKHEVKKYVKRERNKALPDDADYWDFECKYGDTEEVAEVVHLSALNKAIDQARSKDLTSFYIEIIAKPTLRKISIETEEEEDLD